MQLIKIGLSRFNLEVSKYVLITSHLMLTAVKYLRIKLLTELLSKFTLIPALPYTYNAHTHTHTHTVSHTHRHLVNINI